VVSVQPVPPAAVILGAAVVALLAVLIRDAWVVARNVVTIAHEGGHALVALLVGRRLAGIRLHSDTSGVTLSRGRPRRRCWVWGARRCWRPGTSPRCCG
jgi:hypothetical protein